MPDVLLTSGYDPAGNRTSLSATIDGTADFVNGYQYDDMNHELQVTQDPSNVSGHDAVDDKLVNFTYNADGQLKSIVRFHAEGNVLGRPLCGDFADPQRVRASPGGEDHRIDWRRMG